MYFFLCVVQDVLFVCRFGWKLQVNDEKQIKVLRRVIFETFKARSLQLQRHWTVTMWSWFWGEGFPRVGVRVVRNMHPSGSWRPRKPNANLLYLCTRLCVCVCPVWTQKETSRCWWSGTVPFHGRWRIWRNTVRRGRRSQPRWESSSTTDSETHNYMWCTEPHLEGILALSPKNDTPTIEHSGLLYGETGQPRVEHSLVYIDSCLEIFQSWHY